MNTRTPHPDPHRVACFNLLDGAKGRLIKSQKALGRNVVGMTTDRYDNIYHSQVRLSATVTCNQYYLLPCGADGAR